MAAKHVQDPRDKVIDYDLQRVDFEWVSKTEDKKELTKALAALKEDGGFPDLTKATEKRLAELDPAFKRRLDAQHVSAEQRQAVDQEIASFLDDIGKTDRKLLQHKEGGDSIFEGKENRSSNLTT
jgi:hypothetical protein